MKEILTSQTVGVMLALLFYVIGHWLYQKTKISLFNPLLFSAVLLIIYVKIFNIELNKFLTDLSGISLF